MVILNNKPKSEPLEKGLISLFQTFSGLNWRK